LLIKTQINKANLLQNGQKDTVYFALIESGYFISFLTLQFSLIFKAVYIDNHS